MRQGLGDIAMYDSRLYHWSDEHKEDKPRRALYVRGVPYRSKISAAVQLLRVDTIFVEIR